MSHFAFSVGSERYDVFSFPQFPQFSRLSDVESLICRMAIKTTTFWNYVFRRRMEVTKNLVLSEDLGVGSLVLDLRI